VTAHGLFRVQLLRSTRIGQSIEVEVEGIPGWLLYQPADGRVVVPEQPQTVTLKLLPKGSLRFLGSQGLASLLARMMSEAKESARASPAVPLGSVPPPVDLKGPMQKWASEYGLSLEQVQTAVDKWAKEVLSRKQQDDEQVCLAHYSQKQLEQAALCFDELAQKDVQELERLKAQVLERTERAVRRFVKAADAYKLRYDFAAALAEYEKAARWAKRDGSPALWAEVQNLLGIAHKSAWNPCRGRIIPRPSGAGRLGLPLRAGGLYEKRPAARLGRDPEQPGGCAQGPSEPDARDRGHRAAGAGRLGLPLRAGGLYEKRPAARLGR
jgi:tetratricopeptide (TPR) repeat protein